MAIFLIFAPGGVPASLWLTVEQVRAMGYAILFVVNGPVPEADAVRLVAQSWRLLRRPNLGYDFGGYRDAVLHIGRLGSSPERMLFVNDTFWSTAVAGPSSLAALDAIDAPYAALCSFTYRPRGRRPKELVRRIYGCSFGFVVDRSVIKSAAFQSFWRNMRLYEDKEDVVRYGEVGFSHAMMGAGFTPQFVLDQARVLDDIRAMPDAEVVRLFHLLPVLSTVNRLRHQSWSENMAVRPADPVALRALVIEMAEVMNPWDTYACYGLLAGQVDFIKKSNFKSRGNARRLLEMTEGCGVTLTAVVRQELLARADVT
ncbi:MAG: hypothetical protein H7317_17540 [Pseudorhodobacter sp.]|nr:hypothetical protein [Pseudorhodobacter sp.]